MKLGKQIVEKQRQALKEERKKLRERIKKLKKYPEIGDSDDENAMETIEFQSNLSLEEQLTNLLEKVSSALRAIENGSYGRCLSCQNDIEIDRLLVMPYADLCIDCTRKLKNKI